MRQHGLPLRPIHSREGNHTNIGAGSNEEDKGTRSTPGPLNPHTIQITQEYEVVKR